MIVYVIQDHHLDFTSRYCHTWNLKPGINLVGSGCIQDGLSAAQLLEDIGVDRVISIQRFDYDSGRVETLGVEEAGQLIGIDFPIVPGEGYFIHMKEEVPGYKP